MTNIQTMLVMAGMVLLALISLRFNQAVLQTSTSDIESKIALTAFSLADDLIEEIKVKAFDEATIKFPTAATSNLSDTSNFGMGKDVGELFNGTPDDIDDYHGYSRIVDAPHAENYKVSCKVHYVNENSPDVISAVQTFHKRVTVIVTSDFYRNPIELSFIFTLK